MRNWKKLLAAMITVSLTVSTNSALILRAEEPETEVLTTEEAIEEVTTEEIVTEEIPESEMPVEESAENEADENLQLDVIEADESLDESLDTEDASVVSDNEEAVEEEENSINTALQQENSMEDENIPEGDSDTDDDTILELPIENSGEENSGVVSDIMEALPELCDVQISDENHFVGYAGIPFENQIDFSEIPDELQPFTQVELIWTETEEIHMESDGSFHGMIDAPGVYEFEVLIAKDGEQVFTIVCTLTILENIDSMMTISGNAVKNVPYKSDLIPLPEYSHIKNLEMPCEGLEYVIADGGYYLTGIPKEAGDFSFENMFIAYDSSVIVQSWILRVTDNSDVNVNSTNYEGDYITDVVDEDNYIFDIFADGVDFADPENIIHVFVNGTEITDYTLEPIELQRGANDDLDMGAVIGCESARIIIAKEVLADIIEENNTIAVTVKNDARQIDKQVAHNFTVTILEESDEDQEENNASPNGDETNTGKPVVTPTVAPTVAPTAAPTVAPTAAPTSKPVKSVDSVFILLDKSGKPLKDYVIEIVGANKSGTTNADGSVSIYGLELGKYTLQVKTMDGTVYKTNEFTVVEGNEIVFGKDVLSVRMGKTVCITVKLEEPELFIVEAAEQKVNPQTGDDNNVMGLLFMLLMSCGVIIGLFAKKEISSRK